MPPNNAPPIEDQQPAIALVIGLSSNGIAIARALAKEGIEVFAIAQDRKLPAYKTKYAKVFYYEGINSEKLIDALQDIQKDLPKNRKVVLFPTSDNMVRQLGNNWSQLNDTYLLSWSHCKELILDLIDKDNLANYCASANVRYPKSININSTEEYERIANEIDFPIVVKPTKSLSSFKAEKIHNHQQLEELISKFQHDLPFVLQQAIEGPENELYFHTMILDHGKVLAEFTGRKLRTYPSEMGLGTVLENYDCEQTKALAHQFVAELPLSGPIAIEFKRDKNNNYWLIEPNVGRTEATVDLVIQYGINLPAIEYWIAQGKHPENIQTFTRPVIWFDTERDVLSYLSTCIRHKSLRPLGKYPVFLYLGHNDSGPFARATMQLLNRFASKLAKIPKVILRR